MQTHRAAIHTKHAGAHSTVCTVMMKYMKLIVTNTKSNMEMRPKIIRFAKDALIIPLTCLSNEILEEIEIPEIFKTGCINHTNQQKRGK